MIKSRLISPKQCYQILQWYDQTKLSDGKQLLLAFTAEAFLPANTFEVGRFLRIWLQIWTEEMIQQTPANNGVGEQ